MKKQVVETTDLRSITRGSEKVRTTVKLYGDDGWSKDTWLVLGECHIRPVRDHFDGRWTFSAYLPEGVTDFEHDSAYAIKLPLTGLTFEGVEYGDTTLFAWVAVYESEDFRVPDPGYNPMQHPEAQRCTSCKKNKHLIVPEGFFVPPANQTIFEKVRGRKIQITIGPNRD